jgi:hypothetical protein
VPPAGLLDRLVPDRPAWLESRDGHTGWANAAALALAGVGSGSPDPPRGRLERDAGGAPTGVLHEEAMRLVERVVPRPAPGELAAALAVAQEHLHALGITAWQDAWVLPWQLDAYRAAAAAGGSAPASSPRSSGTPAAARSSSPSCWSSAGRGRSAGCAPAP